MNRELRLAVGLLAVGALLALVGVRHDWGTLRQASSLTITDVRTGLPGTLVARSVQVLAALGLAGVAALAATRRLGRVAVGAVLAVAGALVILDVVRDLDGLGTALGLAGAGCGEAVCIASQEQTDVRVLWAWPVLTLLGGVLLLAGGLLVAVRGRRWAALSAAYEPPTGQPPAVPPAGPPSDKSVWDALDAGDDPTA